MEKATLREAVTFNPGVKSAQGNNLGTRGIKTSILSALPGSSAGHPIDQIQAPPAPGRRQGEQLRDPRQIGLQGCERGKVEWRLDLDEVIEGVWPGAPICTFHLLDTRAQRSSLLFTHTTLDPASINGLSKYLMFYSHGKEHTQGIWTLVNEINTYKSKSIC